MSNLCSVSSRRCSSLRVLVFFTLVAFVSIPAGHAQSQPAGPPPATTPPPATSGSDVINYLNDSIRWYREATSQTSAEAEPGDALILSSNRKLADQYLQLAFQYARTQAALLEKGGAQKQDDTDNSRPATTATRLQTSLDRVESRITDLKRELDAVEDRLSGTRGPQRQQLAARRDLLNSQIALAEARRDSLTTFLGYLQSPDGRSGNKASLTTQIDELERGVPELHADTKTAQDSGARIPDARAVESASSSRSRSSGGLASAVTSLFRIRQDISSIDRQLRGTSDLQDTARKLVRPLIQTMQATTARAEELHANLETANTATIIERSKELDELTRQFRLISSTTLPLGRGRLLLENYKGNLSEWRQQLDERGRRRFFEITVRLGVLAAFILIVLALSNLWRRATLRYVTDQRRQNQLLLVRRIVVATVITFVIALAVVSETGNLATYAGLVTAGLAVALQNIILSLIAYFFLIGRYGVHVGDRVTISGVTGEVLEIGLLRLHLTELGGDPSDLHATGRVVVFSNAVILQPTAHFFKQAPAADYSWHEMKVTCPMPASCEQTRDKIAEVVDRVFEAQAANTSKSVGRVPKPVVRVLVGESGPRILVRYPVHVRGTSEVDEQVNRAVLSIVQSAPVTQTF